ncbi:OLC1v1005977C1 [Oldenlandia corymbosa var. corymbosa]|uniref:OLC1v1005977C1 n=1 Tax=Oldenlandia corymbosa var. corymbosa TaxID=529605 RepID=A0AAV1DGK6_OLDCO|nr:OLC1v1005977C1 [Oldenlandia corymbosa var. corymbosa]
MAVAAESVAANTPPSSAAGGGRGMVMVVGPEDCSPYPMELAMKRKVFSRSEKLAFTGVSGNILFRVQSLGFSRRKLRIVDAAGVPILTLKHKAWSWRGRWQVFRGEGNHLICSVRSSASAFFQTKKKVYLANNTTENVCDFQIQRWCLEDSYVVYAGESKTTAVAETHEPPPGFFSLGKGKYTVSIQPNIGHAFIVALTVILDAMKSSGGGGGGGDFGGGGD